MTDLSALLRATRLPTLIAGDFNCHHVLWGSLSTNPRGLKLVEFLAEFDLHVFNAPDSLPTFDTPRGRSWIDLTIGSSSVLRLLDHWEVLDVETCSDHRLVSFDLRSSSGSAHPIEPELAPRFAIKNADWTKFSVTLRRNELLRVLSETVTVLGAEDCVGMLTDAVVDVCDHSLPKQRYVPLRSTPWWTRELGIMRKRVRALRRRFQRQRHPALREHLQRTFQKENALYKRALLEAKTKSWKAYCASVNREPFGIPYKIATSRVFRPAVISRIQLADGTFTSTLRESLSFLLANLFPEDDDSRPFDDSPPVSAPDPQFTAEELECVIRWLPKGKAPGIDCLNYEIIEQVFKEFPSLLLDIFNRCLELTTFPAQWQTAQVVLFNKVDKNPELVRSYRPICLLPALGKILEKLIQRRLLFHAFRAKAFSDTQYGFLPQRSTTQAISNLVNAIRRNKEDGFITCLVSLDIQGAFDHLRWNSVLHALKEMNCPVNLWKLVQSYFMDRTAQITVGGETLSRRLTRGCPQGSCLGPLFWNLVIDSALRLPYPDGVRVQAFADDLVLVVTGSTRRAIESLGNRALGQLVAWSSLQGLTFSTSKCTACVFQPRGQMKRRPTLKIAGESISCRSSIRYLGVELDDTLSFLPHLRTLRDRITIISQNLLRMARRYWGLPGPALKVIYKGAIERMATYACGSWWKPSGNSKMVQLLNSIQRVPLLVICRSYRTVSTDALQVLSGCMPLHMVVSQEAALFHIKLRGEASHLSNTFSFSPEPPLDPQSIHPALRNAIYFSDVEHPSQLRDIDIYTDASKNDGKVGIGYCAFVHGSIIHQSMARLNDEASIFQAEARAIWMALQWIIEHFPDGEERFAVISDSRSVLQALSNPFSTDRFLVSIQTLSHEIRRQHPLAFYWTRAHVGTPGNELADHLAKQASGLGEIKFVHPTSTHTIKHTLKNMSLHMWQQNWNFSEKGRFTHRFLPEVSEDNNIFDPHLSQMLTGHGPFPAYLNRVDRIDSPACPCGAELGDAEHYLCDCVLTASRRAALWINNPRHIFLGLDVLHNDNTRLILQDIAKFLNRLIDEFIQN